MSIEGRTPIGPDHDDGRPFTPPPSPLKWEPMYQFDSEAELIASDVFQRELKRELQKLVALHG